MGARLTLALSCQRGSTTEVEGKTPTPRAVYEQEDRVTSHKSGGRYSQVDGQGASSQQQRTRHLISCRQRQPRTTAEKGGLKKERGASPSWSKAKLLPRPISVQEKQSERDVARVVDSCPSHGARLASVAANATPVFSGNC